MHIVLILAVVTIACLVAVIAKSLLRV